MEILNLFIRWLHITSAAIWVGGNLFLAMVLVPYFKRRATPVQRIKAMSQIGGIFEPIGWSVVLILIFTGLYNIFTSGVFSSPDLAGPFMRTLSVKLLLVFVLIILNGVHGFIMGPKLAQAVDALPPGVEELPDDIEKMRSRMGVVSRLIGIISVLILLAAAALRLGI
jgi:uncharacterized membrane protein